MLVHSQTQWRLYLITQGIYQVRNVGAQPDTMALVSDYTRNLPDGKCYQGLYYLFASGKCFRFFVARWFF